MGTVKRILDEAQRSELARWVRQNPDGAREVLSDLSMEHFAQWIEQGRVTYEIAKRLGDAMEEEEHPAEGFVTCDEEYFDRIDRARDVAKQYREGW